MILDMLSAVWLYLIFSEFALIGIALWVVVGERTISLHHYVTGKLLGLLLFAWIAWWGSVLHWAPFHSMLYLWGLFILLAAGAALIVWRSAPVLDDTEWRALGRQLVSFELISLAFFLVYLYLRAFHPQLESTEKYMDLAFLTAAQRADVFPFMDFWQSNLTVNYYYYGYVLLAAVATLSDVAPGTAYNIFTGLIFVLTLQLSFLLVRAATGSRLAALIGAGLVTFAGNFHYAGCYLSNLWTDVAIGTACFYPKATRIYDPSFTINEMPSYSFLLNDLHPHVISIPFFLLGLTLLWRVWSSPRPDWRWMLLLVFTLAANATVHVWDMMTLGTFLFVLFSARILLDLKQRQDALHAHTAGHWSSASTLLLTSLVLAVTALSPFVLYWPFFSAFQSPVAGIGFGPSFSAMAEIVGTAQYPSSPVFLLGFWGVMLIPITLSLLILWPRWFAGGSAVTFALLLTGQGLGLIAFTELFFFKDFFHVANPPYFRTNTVFKLGYHAWILLSIAAAILLHGAWRHTAGTNPAARRILLAFTLPTFAAAMIFPLEGMRQVFGPRFPWALEGRTLTLDGSAFIAGKNLADWEAILWLRRETQGRPVLLEAVGGSYSYAGRLGVFSGAINPLNWASHQWTWRFAYPPGVKDWHQVRARIGETGTDAIAQHETDLRTIYETTDPALARELIERYRIRYLYIGDLEREKYPQIQESLLRGLGTEVFSYGESRLIEVQPESAAFSGD